MYYVHKEPEFLELNLELLKNYILFFTRVLNNPSFVMLDEFCLPWHL